MEISQTKSSTENYFRIVSNNDWLQIIKVEK